MKYFSLSDRPTCLTDAKYFAMARIYWGTMPLPYGAKLLGGYSDDHRVGALIRLVSGICVCGNAGAISNIPQTTL